MQKDKVNVNGTMRRHKGLGVSAPTASSEKYYRGKLGESLIQKYPEFNLRDPKVKIMDWTYNNLHDPHLKDFFRQPEKKRSLTKQGLITQDDKVLCSRKEFTQYLNYTRDVEQSWEKFLLQQQNIQQRLEKRLLQNQNVQQIWKKPCVQKKTMQKSRNKAQKQQMAVQHRPYNSGVSSVAENMHDSPVPALVGSKYPGCPSLSSSAELSSDALRLCSSSSEYLIQTAAEPTIKVHYCKDSAAIISTVSQESCSQDLNSLSHTGSFSGYPETSTNNILTLEPRDDIDTSPRKALRKSSGTRPAEISSLEVCVFTSNSEGPTSMSSIENYKSSQTSSLDSDIEESDLDLPSLPLFSTSSTTAFTKGVQDSAVPVLLDSMYHPALSSSAELSSDFFSLCSSSSEDMVQTVAEPTIKVLYSIDSPDILSSTSEESCSPANSVSHTSGTKDEVAAALDIKSSHMAIVGSDIDEVLLSSLPLPSSSSRKVITEGDIIPSTSEGSKSFNFICHVSSSRLSMIGKDIVDYTMERSVSALEHHGLLATQQTSDDSNESSSLESESASGSPCCASVGPIGSHNCPDSCCELIGGYSGKNSVTEVHSEITLEAFRDETVSEIQSLLVKGHGTPSTIEGVIAEGNTEDKSCKSCLSYQVTEVTNTRNTLAAPEQALEVDNTSAGSKPKKKTVRAFFKRAWQAVKWTFVCAARSNKIGPAV